MEQVIPFRKIILSLDAPVIKTGHFYLKPLTMQENKFEFTYKVYPSIDALDKADADLLRKAIEASRTAYAPYSKFNVGAAAKLLTGEVITGTNQENASYPVSICAERVLLSGISIAHPGTAIDTMAISYTSNVVKSDHPISPCGMCRQALHEFEERMQTPIRLILGGETGKVFIINSSDLLLPLAFTSKELS